MKLIRILALCTVLLATRASAYTNRVMLLDGAGDYIDVASSAALMPSSEITIEMWVFPEACVGGDPRATWLKKGDGVDCCSSQSYEILQNANHCVIAFFLGTQGYTEGWAPAPPGQWTHIAATYSQVDGLFRVFTNGTLNISTTVDAAGQPLASRPLRASTPVLRIGGNPFFAGVDGLGMMDDVRIWNEARTEGEIRSDIGRKLTGKEAGLVAWWHFDNANGQDATGNGHTGTPSVGLAFQADNSSPALTIDTAVAVRVPVAFPTTLHRLQRSENLATPAWGDIGADFGGTHGEAAALQSIQGDDLVYFRATKATNQVLRLDGLNDYMQVASKSDLMPADEITLEAWINPQANAGAPAARWLTKSDGQSASSSRSFEWYQAGEFLEAYIFIGTDTYTALAVPTPSFQWTHVAVTYDRFASEVIAYTNGVISSRSTVDAAGFPINSKAIRTSTPPLRIGNILSGGFATGLIDDVRIWGEARTSGEIRRDMSRRLTGKEAALVAWWHFDAADGADATGLGHTGTFFGGPAFLADTTAPVIGIETAMEVAIPTMFPSTTYRLQGTGSLLTPNWMDIGDGFAGTPGETRVLQSTRGLTYRYFRVVQQ